MELPDQFENRSLLAFSPEHNVSSEIHFSSETAQQMVRDINLAGPHFSETLGGQPRADIDSSRYSDIQEENFRRELESGSRSEGYQGQHDESLPLVQ